MNSIFNNILAKYIFKASFLNNMGFLNDEAKKLSRYILSISNKSLT